MSELQQKASNVLFKNMFKDHKIVFSSNKKYIKSEIDKMVCNLTEQALEDIINE